MTKLAIAGCTEPEIASITGHTLGDVRSILDAYLHRYQALADNAIRKLEKGTNLPNAFPNASNVLLCTLRRQGKTKRDQLAGGRGFEPRLNGVRVHH